MKKLVRDKIPEIIEKSGKTPVIHTAKDKEYWEELKNKLNEEVNEFLEEENKEELADIIEVIHTISDYKQFNMEEIKSLRKQKSEERGGFKDRIILDRVE